MPKEKPAWRKFTKLKIDGTSISKKAKKMELATTRHAHKFIAKRWDSISGARQTIIGWVLLVATLIAAVGLQMTWFQREYQVEATAGGGTYAEAVLGPIDTLNPLYASSSAELSAGRLLFSSLYRYDEGGKLSGDLARTSVVENEGKTYTIKLKPNIKWHDGTLLTASDVAFTVNLIKDPSTRSYLSPSWQGIGVEALDDTTVKFTLPASIAAFPHALTFAILPKHVLKDVAPGNVRENKFSQSPVGSGPFSLRLLQTVDQSSGTKVVHMSSFDQYYKGIPKLNRFQLHAYASQDEIIAALKTGEVNGAADLSNEEIKSISTSRYSVENLPINNGVYALFNTQGPILKDKTVRQALRLAIDTNAVRKTLSAPVQPLDLPFLAGQISGGGLPVVPAVNATQAAGILDAAGWHLEGGVRKKDGQMLTLRLVTIKDSEYEKVVQSLVSQWRALGIKAETLVVDPADNTQDITQTILQPRNYDVLVYELMIGADPDVYAYWHSSQATNNGRNLSNYSSPIVDDALSSARSRVEPALRDAKYISFARQWIDDAPAIGLYQSNFAYIHSRQVDAVSPTRTMISPQSRYSDVQYWTVEHGTVYKTP